MPSLLHRIVWPASKVIDMRKKLFFLLIISGLLLYTACRGSEKQAEPGENTSDRSHRGSVPVLDVSVDFAYSNLSDLFYRAEERTRVSDILYGEILAVEDKDVEITDPEESKNAGYYTVYEYKIKVLLQLTDKELKETVFRQIHGVVTNKYYERYFEMKPFDVGTKLLVFIDQDHFLSTDTAYCPGYEDTKRILKDYVSVRSGLLPFFTYQDMSPRSLGEVGMLMKADTYLTLIKDYLFTME